MRGDVTELRRPVWLEGVDGGAGQLLALRTLQGCLGKGQGGWWRYAGLNGVPPPRKFMSSAARECHLAIGLGDTISSEKVTWMRGRPSL